MVISLKTDEHSDDQVTFMNELCQKLMTYVASVFHKDDFDEFQVRVGKNKKSSKLKDINPSTLLDIKMFYIFEN